MSYIFYLLHKLITFHDGQYIINCNTHDISLTSLAKFNIKNYMCFKEIRNDKLLLMFATIPHTYDMQGRFLVSVQIMLRGL